MADVRTLVVKVKSDGVSQATTQLNNFATAASKAEDKVMKLIKTVDKMAQSFLANASGTKALTDALAIVNRSTLASDAAMKALSQSMDRLSGNVSTLNTKFQQGTSGVTNNTQAIRQHTVAMTDAHAAARGLTGSLGALWLTYGNVAPLAAGAAIGASMKAIISIGVDVANTLENIRIKGENSMESMKDVAKAINDLGKGVYGPQEVAQALETLSLAGLKAKDAVNAIGAAMNLAIVGGTDINKAAEALVTIGTAVGATSKEYDYLADGIAKAANISLASVDSIAEAVKRASVVNKLYGASFEDILTQTAALAQLGIKNSAAGTAITNFYANALGGTEKAKAALDALGFSFQDATGKAKPLVAAFEEFTAKLNGFDLKSQQKIITEIFGERALRDVEGLRDLVNQAAESTERLADGTLKYKNRLEEVQAQIQDSAGTSALQAAQQALTTENQIKSMINTLKSAFGDAFGAIEPQVRDITAKLKELFGSNEFQTVLKNIASGFMAVADAIISNIGPLTAIAEGFLAVAAATAGGALFTKLVPVVQGLIVVMTGLATSMTSAGTAATIGAAGMTAFSTAAKLLPGIGIAIGLVSSAYALYSLHADKAKDSTLDLAAAKAKMAESYNTDFIKALETEAQRLDEVNKKIATGLTLQQAELETTKQLALEKQKNYNKEAVDSAEVALKDAKKNYSKFMFSYDAKDTQAYKDMVKAQEDLNKAKQKQSDFDRDAAKWAQDIIDKTKQQQEQLRINAATAEAIAMGKSGDNTYNGKDKGANKQLTFLENERLELEKVTAQYDAKTAALIKSYNMGSRVAAESYQAAVEVNKLEGKYASEAAYRSELALARAADEAKFNHANAVSYTELGNKMKAILEGEKAYQEQAVSGGEAHFGTLRRQAEAMIKVLKLTEQQASEFRSLADAADAVNKTIDARAKLESAIGSATQRAGAAREEAEAMALYGEKAKVSAMAAAELYIQKLNLNSVADQSRINALREAAALEQVNVAWRNLEKSAIESSKELEKAETDGLLVFVEKEQEKVRIKAEHQKMLAKMDLDRADKAANANPFSIDAQTAALSAIGAYYQTIENIDETTRVKINNANTQDWKKTVDGIVNDTLKGFDTILDRGTSIWGTLTKSIRTMFKQTVLDFIKKEFAKPIVLNLIANVAGSLGFSGLADTATKMGGDKGGDILSNLSSATKIFDLVNKGLTSFSTGVGGIVSTLGNLTGSSGLSAFGAGMGMTGAQAADAAAAYNAAGMTGTGSAISGGAAAAPWVAGVGGALAGRGLGNMISGGMGRNGIVNGGTAIGAIVGSIVPVLGTALGGLLGGIAGGVFNKLFGMGPKTVQSQGISGTLSDSGTTGQAYSKWTQKGGLFRSNKSGTDTSALGDDIINTLTSGFTTLKATSVDFAKNIGVSSGALDGFTKSFDIAFGDDQQKNQEAVTKFFTDLGDELANKLVPNLAEFAMQGETASGTLERLSGIFQTTNQVAAILGKTVSSLFGSEGLDSAKIRQSLVDIAGGADVLTSKTTAYVSSIYNDAQKLQPVQKALEETFNTLNIKMPESKQAFKDIVDGLNLQDVAQQKLYVSLISLAPAFAQVMDAADEAAKQAAEAAKDAADKLKEAQQAAVDAAKTTLDRAFDRLKKSVDAQKAMLDKQFDAEIANIKAVGEAKKKAAQTELDAAKKYVTELDQVSSAIANALGSTAVDSPAINKAKRQSAQGYLSGLSGTDLTKATGLDEALKAVTAPSEDFFATFEDYVRDQAATANTLNDLKNQNDTAKSFAELTVDRLNDTIDAIEKSTQDQIDAATSRHQAEIDELDKLIDNAQIQIDALNGINSSLISLTEALMQFNQAIAGMAGATGQPTPPPLVQGPFGYNGDAAHDAVSAYGNQYGGDAYYLNDLNNYSAKEHYAKTGLTKGIYDQDYFANVQALYDAGLHPKSTDNISKSISTDNKAAVEELYKSVLGRASDSTGLSYWAAKLEQGTSNIDQIKAAFLNSDEYKKLQGFAVGTNFVTKDMPAMIHEGERIMPAADNAELMRRLDKPEESETSNAEVARLLSELIETIRTGDVANAAQTKEVARILKKFDQDGLPEERATT